MREIDWSKAPEGATHARNCGWENPDWYKIVDGVLMVHSCNEGWDESGYSDMGEIPNLQTRPAKAWTGTGLPPVGIEVEWLQFSGYEWERVTVLAYYADMAWILTKDGWPKTVANPANFRPIRTQAKIEAEERDRAISEMFSDSRSHKEHFLSSVFGALYDAGYRKQGEAK